MRRSFHTFAPMLSRTFLISLIISVVFYSCKKEYSFESAYGTLKDSAGMCFNAIVHGIYKKDVSLTADNYMLLPVNVSRLGRYSINSDTVNGYWFSGSGMFGHLGMDTIKLIGKGRPVQYSSNTFLIAFGKDICPNFVDVPGPYTNGSISCIIDGEENIFSENRGGMVLSVYSNWVNITGGKENEAISISVGKFPGPIVEGIYNSEEVGNFINGCNYAKDQNTSMQSEWMGGTGKAGSFTVSISHITLDRVQGTFSGTIYDNSGTATMTITKGVFDVPFY